MNTNNSRFILRHIIFFIFFFIIKWHFTSLSISLDVNVSPDEDTVWLSANEIALLFERDEKTVRKHINNVFLEKEVEKNNNTHFLRVVGVKQKVAFYEITIIDQYADKFLLTMLSDLKVKITIVTSTSSYLNKEIIPNNITIIHNDIIHDRFIIVDHLVYAIGSSFNGIGKKGFFMMKLENITKNMILNEKKA